MNTINEIKRRRTKNTAVIIILVIAVVVMAFACLFAGSSNMTFADSWNALMGNSSPARVRIMWVARMPRMIAAIVAGAGLAVAGLIMQTTLNNPMASPSTLGVSNAAVFGANLSIIVFAGGFLDTGKILSIPAWWHLYLQPFLCC